MVDSTFRAQKVDVVIRDDEYLTSAFLSTVDRLSYWAFCRHEDPFDDDGTVYIEKDDQGWSTYGGVRECTLSGSGLRLLLDGEAARRLQAQEEIRIAFDLSSADFARLRQAFDSMFRDHPRYKVRP